MWYNGAGGDFLTHLLVVDDEVSILEYLAKNRGQVFAKEQIYEAVFGFDGIGDNSTISTHIKNIRAKLEHFKISPISTVWRIGYKWE